MREGQGDGPGPGIPGARREPADDPGRDPDAPQEDGHGRREIGAIPSLDVEQEEVHPVPAPGSGRRVERVGVLPAASKEGFDPPRPVELVGFAGRDAQRQLADAGRGPGRQLQVVFPDLGRVVFGSAAQGLRGIAFDQGGSRVARPRRERRAHGETQGALVERHRGIARADLRRGQRHRQLREAPPRQDLGGDVQAPGIRAALPQGVAAVHAPGDSRALRPALAVEGVVGGRAPIAGFGRLDLEDGRGGQDGRPRQARRPHAAMGEPSLPRLLRFLPGGRNLLPGETRFLEESRVLGGKAQQRARADAESGEREQRQRDPAYLSSSQRAPPIERSA